MNPKTFNILGLVTALSVLAAILVGTSDPEFEIEFEPGSYLFTELDVDDVAQIVIQDPTSTVTLERRSIPGTGQAGVPGSERSGFFVEQGKLTYPADPEKVNQVLQDLLEIRTKNLVSRSQDAHESFGLKWPYPTAGIPEGSKDYPTSSVQLLDGNGEVLQHYLLGQATGEESTSPGGFPTMLSYVRLASDDRVYLADSNLVIYSLSDSYLDKDLIEVDRPEITRVTVATNSEGGPGESYSIQVQRNPIPRKDTYILSDIPDGQEGIETSLKQVTEACLNFGFKSFAPAEEAADLVFDRTYVLETELGTVFRVQLAQQSETTGEGDSATTTTKWFAKVRADWAGQDLSDRRNIQQFNKEIQEAEGAELQRKLAIVGRFTAVAPFNERHTGWVYEIDTWRSTNMAKPKAELLRPVPPAPTSQEGAEGEATPTNPADPSNPAAPAPTTPPEPEVATARHILISWDEADRSAVGDRDKDAAKILALDILERAKKQPERFERLAQTYTDDAATKVEGGLLGSFERKDMEPAFSAAVLALEPGAVGPELVETRFGFHIVMRID